MAAAKGELKGLYEDTKFRESRSRAIDLSTANTAGIFLFRDRKRAHIVESIDFVCSEEAVAAASTLNIGTNADDDALVAAHAIAASIAIGVAEALTVATTLKPITGAGAMSEVKGRAVIPANTAILIKNSASGGAGIGHVQINTIPIQANNE